MAVSVYIQGITSYFKNNIMDQVTLSTMLKSTKIFSYKIMFFMLFALISCLSLQAQITGAWSQSGPGGEWQAQAGSVYVRVVSTSNVTNLSAQTMGCAGAYSDVAVDNNPSLRFTANTPTTGNIVIGYFDGPTSTTQVFVETPVLHVDRVGGDNGGVSNSGLFTLASGSWTEVSQNDVHFESTANSFNRTTGAGVVSNAECGGPNAGTAAGSLEINTPNTGFTLNTSQAPGGANGADAIEIVLTGMVIFDPCTDGATSGTPTANDPDGDGFNNVCDLDDDNDGILDKDEGGCGTMLFSFDNGNEGWNQDNNNDGTIDSPVGHSSATTTGQGCPTPGMTGATGNYLVHDDLFAGGMYFESPDNMNLCLQNSVGGALTFLWRNESYAGVGAGGTAKPIVLNGAGISVSASFNDSGLGWQSISIPLDDATWSGTLADLEAVLEDLDRIEIRVEDITGSDFAFGATSCSNAEWFALDEVQIICTPLDTDGDNIADYLDLDSDNDGCPDYVEGGGTFTEVDNGEAAGGTLSDGNGDMVTTNLGNTVEDTDPALLGVPIVDPATTAVTQDVGSSQNAGVNACIDPCTDGATAGTPTANDPDADGYNNVCDLDDDNDGILDSAEGCNSVFTPTGAVNGDPTAQTYSTTEAGNSFVLSTTNTSTINNTSR